jgi:acetyl esterase/lipase
MPLETIAKGLLAVVKLRRRIRGPRRPSWDAQYEAWATMLHHYAKRSTRLPLSWQRRAMKPPKHHGITRRMRFERVSAGGVSAEWFRAADSDESRVLVYLHGGGYSLGSIESHRELVTRFCLATGVRALVLDYRLAPEHPFPAQLDDALAAYRWLLSRGIDSKRIAIAGESAGGGLTMSTLVAARDAGDPLPAGSVVISPWVDLEMTGGTMRANERYDFVNRATLEVFARRFVRDHERRNPLASALHADLAGLPPLLIQAGGAETLLDDARRLAERARRAGVDVELDVGEDMVHAWHVFASFSPEARKAIDRASSFLRARLGLAGVAKPEARAAS